MVAPNGIDDWKGPQCFELLHEVRTDLTDMAANIVSLHDLDILDRGGYSGPMSVEIEFSEGGWPSVHEVHEAVKTARQNVLRLLELHW